jgi:signal transduction histidine kinase
MLSSLLLILLTALLTTLAEGVVFLWQHQHYQYYNNKEKHLLAVARKISGLLLQMPDAASVMQKVADFLPNELDFATGVIVLYEKDTNMLRRVAASNTTEAAEAIKALRLPFNQIAISLDDPQNLMARALREKKEFVTENIFDVFVPVLSQQDAANIQRILGTKSTFIYPMFVTERPLGVFLASSKKKASQLTDYEKNIISVFVDGAGIALQNARLYSSLAQTTDQLTQTNQRLSEALTKLQELDHLKDEFLAFASHELRTPLTAVLGYVSLLEKALAGTLTDKQRNYIHIIKESAERVIKLVGQLLDESSIQAGRFAIDPKPTDLIQLTQTAVAELLPTAQEHYLTITVQTPPSPLPPVLADSDKIKEVLINILGNATKFTPAGGSVTVSFSQQNGMVTTTVKDTGRGVKQEDMQYLFQEYGMIKKNYLMMQENQGTGLGLYISRSIVRLHGGEMTLTSEGKNKGATVSFSLKVAQ